MLIQVRRLVSEITSEMKHENKELTTVLAGSNYPAVEHARVTLEPVRYVHKPLLVFFFKFFMWDIPEPFRLRNRGFSYHYTRGIAHWYRRGTGPERHKAIVIFHGIAVGWTLYMVRLAGF